MNTALVTYDHEVLTPADFEAIIAARRVSDAKAHQAAEKRGRDYLNRLRRNVRARSTVDALDTAFECFGWFCVGYLGGAILIAIAEEINS